MTEWLKALFAALGALHWGSLAQPPASAYRALSEVAPGTLEESSLGVLVLKAPGPAMMRLGRVTVDLGSTNDDVLAALVDCQREPARKKCAPELFAHEMPLHRVTLSAFQLDRTEVTVRAYERCVEVRRCAPLPLTEGALRFRRPDFPASLVTYWDARAYCAFRDARLPTEAEFERAARGFERRVYPWGNFYNSHAANHGRLSWDPTDDRDGFAELAPVASLRAGRTPVGFFDLAGNVSEWVEDVYQAEYDAGDTTNPVGPRAAYEDAPRVVRGGSYESAAPWLRGASRESAAPSTRRPSLGFRCARSEKK